MQTDSSLPASSLVLIMNNITEYTSLNDEQMVGVLSAVYSLERYAMFVVLCAV